MYIFRVKYKDENDNLQSLDFGQNVELPIPISTMRDRNYEIENSDFPKTEIYSTIQFSMKVSLNRKSLYFEECVKNGESGELYKLNSILIPNNKNFEFYVVVGEGENEVESLIHKISTPLLRFFSLRPRNNAEMATSQFPQGEYPLKYQMEIE